jgi:hypothetical protein
MPRFLISRILTKCISQARLSRKVGRWGVNEGFSSLAASQEFLGLEGDEEQARKKVEPEAGMCVLEEEARLRTGRWR